jgi:hypothetical protein
VDIGFAVSVNSTTLSIAWMGHSIEREYSLLDTALMSAKTYMGNVLGGLSVKFAFPKDPGSYAVDTSLEAAEHIKPKAPKLRDRVYQHILKQGTTGATADEVELALGISHQTGAPRITELHRMGRLIRTNMRRKTRYGRNAGVYVADIHMDNNGQWTLLPFHLGEEK